MTGSFYAFGEEFCVVGYQGPQPTKFSPITSVALEVGYPPDARIPHTSEYGMGGVDSEEVFYYPKHPY